VKAGSCKLFVIPAEAGIQERYLDPGFRRGGGLWKLAPGFSCFVVADTVMKVHRNWSVEIINIPNWRECKLMGIRRARI